MSERSLGGNVSPFPGRSPLANGRQPPDPPDMEILKHRMMTLEVQMDRVESRINGFDDRLRSVEVKLGEIGGKIDTLVGSVVSKLPSWWQMPAVIGSTIAVVAALSALAKWAHLVP